MKSLFGIALALALAGAACGDSSTPATTTAPSTSTTSPATETLTGLMPKGGWALRTFTAAAAGPVTVDLTSTDPPATVVGLGIGVPVSGTCNFAQTVATTAGGAPQITTTVDAGSYCAGTFDLGQVPSQGVVVSITFVHP